MPQLDFFNVLSQLESSLIFFIFFYLFTIFFVIPTILTIFNLRLSFLLVSSQLFNSFFFLIVSYFEIALILVEDCKTVSMSDISHYNQFKFFNNQLFYYSNFNEL